MYSRSRFTKPRGNARRWQIAAVAGVAIAIAGVGLGVASADAAVPTVNCPAVKVNVAVPSQAAAEVQSNLQLLNTQIAEANNRLKTTVGQGGKNFIQNAILGPLADKRFATINRIETAIGRNAAKPDLNAEGLKTCTLNQGGGTSAAQPTAVSTGAAAGCCVNRLPARSGALDSNVLVSRRLTSSAMISCWAPSWMLRSSRCRSASCRPTRSRRAACRSVVRSRRSCNCRPSSARRPTVRKAIVDCAARPVNRRCSRGVSCRPTPGTTLNAPSTAPP